MVSYTHRDAKSFKNRFWEPLKPSDPKRAKDVWLSLKPHLRKDPKGIIEKVMLHVIFPWSDNPWREKQTGPRPPISALELFLSKRLRWVPMKTKGVMKAEKILFKSSLNNLLLMIHEPEPFVSFIDWRLKLGK